MKMKQDDYQALSEMVSANYAKRPLDCTIDVWMDFYYIPYPLRQAWFDRGIYDYLNDAHITTALKSIRRGLAS